VDAKNSNRQSPKQTLAINVIFWYLKAFKGFFLNFALFKGGMLK